MPTLADYGRAILGLADELEALQQRSGSPSEPAMTDGPQTRESGLQALARGYGLAPRTVSTRAAQEMLSLFDDEMDDDEMDEQTMMLLEALEQITGRKMAVGARSHAARFNAKQDRWPKGHPQGGQWRPTVSSMVEKLTKWVDGDRKGDPFDGFTDAQLRRVSKERGITVPKGAERDVVAKGLLADLESKELKPHDNPVVDPESRATVAALASGKKVTVHPDRVTPLMMTIAALQPPTFNLSHLKVTGDDNRFMFRTHVPGERPRDTMPQLPTETGKEMDDFVDFLRDQGVKMEWGQMDPRNLIASQNQLSGPKVAKIWGFMEKGWKPGGVMIVARHGDQWAVVDGHHRWAGAAARSMGSGTLNVDVLKIDRDINEVLGTPGVQGLVHSFAKFEGLGDDREAGK